MTSIRDVAEQALAGLRGTVEDAGRAGVVEWLGDPAGLELHTCCVDAVAGTVVVCDSDVTLARTSDGEVFLVVSDGSGGWVRQGRPLGGLADLGRRLAG